MGLPTIATNWSGTTAFLSEATGYPLPYELVPTADDASQLWAEPSRAALRRLMRDVSARPEAARLRGRAARAHIRATYAQATVAEQLVARLQQLEPTLLAAVAEREEARSAARAAEEAGESARRAERLARLGLRLNARGGAEAVPLVLPRGEDGEDNKGGEDGEGGEGREGGEGGEDGEDGEAMGEAAGGEEATGHADWERRGGGGGGGGGGADALPPLQSLYTLPPLPDSPAVRHGRGAARNLLGNGRPAPPDGSTRQDDAQTRPVRRAARLVHSSAARKPAGLEPVVARWRASVVRGLRAVRPRLHCRQTKAEHGQEVCCAAALPPGLAAVPVAFVALWLPGLEVPRDAASRDAAPLRHLDLGLELNSAPPLPRARPGARVGAAPASASASRVQLLPDGRAYAVGPGRWLLPAPNASVRRITLCGAREGGASPRVVSLTLLVGGDESLPRAAPRAEGGERSARERAARLGADVRWWRRACLALGATQVLGVGCAAMLLLRRRGRAVATGRVA